MDCFALLKRPRVLRAYFFQSFPKRRRNEAAAPAISCIFLFFLSLSKMKRCFQEKSTRWLLSRATDYLVHGLLLRGLSALVTDTEEVCCVTAIGKPGKKYMFLV